MPCSCWTWPTCTPTPATTAATPPAVLELVTELCARRDPPAVMLERDDDYPPEPELAAELDAISAATGAARR